MSMNSSLPSNALRQLARRKFAKACNLLISGVALYAFADFYLHSSFLETALQDDHHSFLSIIVLSGSSIIFVALGYCIIVAAWTFFKALIIGIASIPAILKLADEQNIDTANGLLEKSTLVCVATLSVLVYHKDLGRNWVYIPALVLGVLVVCYVIHSLIMSPFDELLPYIIYERDSAKMNSGAHAPVRTTEAAGIEPYPAGASLSTDHYSILGCRATASNTEVKKRYRTLAKQFHPDKLSGQDLPAEFIAFAAEKFRRAKEAFDIIAAERGFS